MPRCKKNRSSKKKRHREPRQPQELQQDSTRAIRRKPRIPRNSQKPEKQIQKYYCEPLFKKATYEVGDRVKARWWETNDWHDGKVHGYRIVDKSSKYGEVRQYHVKFLDGDEDKNISEEDVWSPFEYKIACNEKFFPDHLHQERGIETLFDLETSDPYAKRKGFFKMKFTGEKLYGSYEEVFGAYDEAMKSYAKALRVREELLGTGSADFSNTLHNIGVVIRQKGDSDEARKAFMEALWVAKALDIDAPSADFLRERCAVLFGSNILDKVSISLNFLFFFTDISL